MSAAHAPRHQRSREGQFLTLSKLLLAAAHTDEADIHTGNSCRLLRIASTMAEQFAHGADRRDAEKVEHEAFDVAALVAASRRVPGGKVQTVERAALVMLAGDSLKDLTDCEDGMNDDVPRHG